jgi:hypothetical protein
VGMYLSNGSGCPWGDEVEDNFHYFYVCPLFICQRLLLFTQLRDLAYFLIIDILLKGSPDLSFDDNGFCTMEYVVFSCTQGKKGGGTDILDLICVLNISLLC